jgi:hypothetical protein
MKIFGYDFTSDEDKVYECTECSKMPSLVGMRCYGKPVVDKNSIFVKEGEYRTIKPVIFSETEIFTNKHLKLTIKRIK